LRERNSILRRSAPEIKKTALSKSAVPFNSPPWRGGGEAAGVVEIKALP